MKGNQYAERLQNKDRDCVGNPRCNTDRDREALGGVPLFDVPDFLITVVLALAGALAAFGIYDKIDRTSKGEQ